MERAAHVCHHALRDVSSTLPLDMDSNPDFVETVRIPGSLPSTQSPNKIALTTASHAGALNPHNAPPTSDTALSATKKLIIIHPITSYSYQSVIHTQRQNLPKQRTLSIEHSDNIRLDKIYLCIYNTPQHTCRVGDFRFQ